MRTRTHARTHAYTRLIINQHKWKQSYADVVIIKHPVILELATQNTGTMSSFTSALMSISHCMGIYDARACVRVCVCVCV